MNKERLLIKGAGLGNFEVGDSVPRLIRQCFSVGACVSLVGGGQRCCPKPAVNRTGPVMSHQALWPRYQENLKRQVGARVMFYWSNTEHEGDTEEQGEAMSLVGLPEPGVEMLGRPMLPLESRSGPWGAHSVFPRGCIKPTCF